MAISFNRGYNINRVVSKLVAVVLSLYVGGVIMTVFGSLMNCTTSGFYDGLSLIGWTVSDSVVPSTSGTCNGTGNGALTGSTATWNNVITDPTGSGILAVIGILGIASVVMEFIK